jgi:hypothetical protein
MTVHLGAMPNHAALAMFAYGSDSLNCAFKVVEDMTTPGGSEFKGLVIVVAAYFTFRHQLLPIIKLVTQTSLS